MPSSIASSENGATSPPASAHNPADPAPRLHSSDWRTTQLPRLQGLPLLPVGAGRDGKAPIDTETRQVMTGWPTAAFEPGEIATMPSCVTAVGSRWGPAAGGLLCFDLDGEEALEIAAAAGCEVFSDESWRIVRHTGPDRMKVVWKVPPEQWPDPDDKLHGTATLKTADGGEVRAFWSTGQAVVAGLHRPSDAYLEWIGGPETISVLPAPWLALWQSLDADKGDQPTRLHRGSSKGDWRAAVPCPICGRTKDNDCQQSRDDRFVLCHHGVTHAPPPGLRMGEVIAGNWAFCGERENAIGRCSLFRQHKPRPRPVVLDDPGQSPPSVPDDPGQSWPVVLDDPGPMAPTLGDLFPVTLAGALQDRCRYLPADAPSIAVTVLAAVAGLAKLGTVVVGAEAAGYTVPTNIFSAIVAISGAKKSPFGGLLIHDATAPIRASLRQLHEQEQRAWQEQQAQEQGGKGKRKRPSAEPPRPRLFSVSEVTGEALTIQLAVQEQHGLGLLIHRDEIAGLIGGLNQYRGGRGSDHQQLLEAFDGRGGATLRVKNDAGPRSFERCQLAIYGGIQPGVLRELVAKGDDSGLWARFLFAPLPSKVVPLPPDDPEQTEISNAAAEKIRDAMDAVYRLAPHRYRLAADAGDRFRAFEQEQQERVHAADVDAVSALAGKAAGKVLRVAGLLHLLAIATGEASEGSEVPLQRIEGGIALVTWCDTWTAGIHEAAAAGDDLDAGALVLQLAGSRTVSWNQLKDRLSHRQRQVLPNVATFAAVARQLEADGRGEISQGPRGGLRFTASH